MKWHLYLFKIISTTKLQFQLKELAIPTSNGFLKYHSFEVRINFFYRFSKFYTPTLYLQLQYACNQPNKKKIASK